MIQVPADDPGARRPGDTEWYRSIGFAVVGTNENDGKIDWALLYLNVDRVAELFDTLKEWLEVRDALHDTFSGMREFIVRDPNGFWVTFGESIDGSG